MTVETFFANFGHLADAPNGVQKLRELILQLAVQGKLVPQAPNDEPAWVLLEKIEIERKILFKEGKVRKPKKYETIKVAEQFCPLPNNWCWARMGELILDITGGGTPSKNNPAYWGGDILWASVKDVGKSKYLDSTIDSITPKGLQESSSNLIPKGRVIICTRMGLGKISINRVDVAINQDLKALWLPGSLEIDYFFNFFLTQEVKGTGMTVAGIRQDALLNMPVPLPPLEEQKRIVAKVDQLMALCDELEARQQKQQQGRVRLNKATLDALLTACEPDEFADHWQRISTNFGLLYDHPETIAKLRAAILQLAVQGKLVPQDPNDEPASVLLERVKAERRARSLPANIKRGNLDLCSDTRKLVSFPPEWHVEALSDIALAIVDCPHSTPKWTERGKLCVRTNQFNPGRLDLTESRYVSEQTYIKRIERLTPQADDILYSREGGILGVACRVPENVELCLGQRMMLFRSSSFCAPDFLELVLNSPLITEMARKQTTGGAAPRVNVATVKSYPIPVPPIEEQKRIVAKVDQLMGLCDELEAKLNKVQQHSEKLMEATVRQILVV